MTFHRTFGQTRDCSGCRYWSEMIARAGGGTDNPRGDVEALCLVPSEAKYATHAGKYTVSSFVCPAWKSGHLGAIDDPPDGNWEAYADEDAREADDNGQFGVGA